MTATASEQWIVELYDGFDYEWLTVEGPASYDEAAKVWNAKTGGGRRNTNYDDIDYYMIRKVGDPPSRRRRPAPTRQEDQQ